MSRKEVIDGNHYQSGLKKRHGLINPKNYDNYCFMNAATIAANLEYFKNVFHPERITKVLKDMTYEFDWSGIDFSQKV